MNRSLQASPKPYEFCDNFRYRMSRSNADIDLERGCVDDIKFDDEKARDFDSPQTSPTLTQNSRGSFAKSGEGSSTF